MGGLAGGSWRGFAFQTGSLELLINTPQEYLLALLSFFCGETLDGRLVTFLSVPKLYLPPYEIIVNLLAY